MAPIEIGPHINVSPGTTLTWSLESKEPKSISRNVALEEITNAFAIWQTFVNLNFLYIDDFDSANIRISFEKGRHKWDNSPFDGPGAILAHAAQTSRNDLSFIHFDDEEDWIVLKGTNVLDYLNNSPDLKSVALHEIGHLLGLRHRKDLDTIMRPNYNKYITEPSKEDIHIIQNIYGKRPDSSEPRNGSKLEYFFKIYAWDIGFYVLASIIMIIIIILIVRVYRK